MTRDGDDVKSPARMVNDLLTCTIDTLSYGIFGVARTEQGVVMVAGTVPGDVVRARVVAVRRGYREAELVEVVARSPDRRVPPCRYLPECGGCPWQHVDYPAQLHAKEAILRGALRHAGFDQPELRPIVPSAEWAYRHRVTLRVDGEQRLGFYRHRSHRLVEIETCLIADDTVNAHLATAREWLRGTSTTVRRLEIATAAPGVVVFVGNAEGRFRHDGEFHERFLRRQPAVQGIILFGRGWRRTFGEPRVALDIAPGIVIETEGGFTQVNPEGNRRLVQTVLEMAAPHPDDRLLDLYCGAGNLTLPLARTVGEATGVEVDSQSLDDARRNADRLGLANCRFIQQDAAAAAKGLVAGGERFSLVVLDPPRSGAADVLVHLPSLRPERLLYVSCNPATLARDLERLTAFGFRLGGVQPIDLFPETHHLESVALLVGRC